MMGFSHVDVCFAFRGWHRRSFGNFFPDKKSAQRLCDNALIVTTTAAPITLLVMALQPTKRGERCWSTGLAVV